MSFPASFSSQLAAVLEALMKAVVAEVTALVEAGAVELRLELSEKDREIRELRAALELLRTREEAAVSPDREDREARSSHRCPKDDSQPTLESQDVESMMKNEPTDEFVPDLEPHDSLWPPPPLTAASRFEKNSAEAEYEVYGPSFHSDNEGSSSGSLLNTTEAEPDYFSETDVKVEPQNLPLDIGLTSPASVQNAPLPSFSQDQFDLLQQAELSLPTVHVHNRNNRRTRRLNMWRLNHTEPKTGFRCHQCGKCFTQKRRLVTHQSVHTGEKPFSCKTCGKMFSRRDNCLRHERLHSSGRTYSCGQCGKGFSGLANLQVHLELQHNR